MWEKRQNDAPVEELREGMTNYEDSEKFIWKLSFLCASCTHT